MGRIMTTRRLIALAGGAVIVGGLITSAAADRPRGYGGYHYGPAPAYRGPGYGGHGYYGHPGAIVGGALLGLGIGAVLGGLYAPPPYYYSPPNYYPYGGSPYGYPYQYPYPPPPSYFRY